MNRDQYSSEAEYLIAQSMVPIGEVRQSLARYRTEVLREAIEAGRGEYLNDDTKSPEDEAYNQGVSDAIAAIGALLEDGAR